MLFRSSPNALICGASAVLFASHKSRRAFAADKHSAGSVSAGTTYVIAPISGDWVGEPGTCAGWVVNQEA